MSHLGGHTTEEIVAACKVAREIGKAVVPAWGIPERDWDLVAILYSGAWTQDPRILRSLGGFDLDTAREVRNEARRFGLWTIHRGRYCVGSNWHDPETGQDSLLCDYMVLVGDLVRIVKDGEVHYDLAERYDAEADRGGRHTRYVRRPPQAAVPNRPASG